MSWAGGQVNLGCPICLYVSYIPELLLQLFLLVYGHSGLSALPALAIPEGRKAFLRSVNDNNPIMAADDSILRHGDFGQWQYGGEGSTLCSGSHALSRLTPTLNMEMSLTENATYLRSFLALANRSAKEPTACSFLRDSLR